MKKIASAFMLVLFSYSGVVFADFRKAFSLYEGGDYKKAEVEFLACAKNGDADCQYHLAFLLLPSGPRWLRKSEAESIEWYKKASDNGNGYARYELGMIYLNKGKTVEGTALIDLAANDGVVHAMNYLGVNAFEQGRNSEAFRYFSSAADKGFAEAKANLSHFYIAGIFVEKNYKKAKELLDDAVSKGNALGCYNLAQMYVGGIGVDVDYEKAIALLEQAKSLGFIEGRNIDEQVTAIKKRINDSSAVILQGSTVGK